MAYSRTSTDEFDASRIQQAFKSHKKHSLSLHRDIPKLTPAEIRSLNNANNAGLAQLVSQQKSRPQSAPANKHHSKIPVPTYEIESASQTKAYRDSKLKQPTPSFFASGGRESQSATSNQNGNSHYSAASSFRNDRGRERLRPSSRTGNFPQSSTSSLITGEPQRQSVSGNQISNLQHPKPRSAMQGDTLTAHPTISRPSSAASSTYRSLPTYRGPELTHTGSQTMFQYPSANIVTNPLSQFSRPRRQRSSQNVDDIHNPQPNPAPEYEANPGTHGHQDTNGEPTFRKDRHDRGALRMSESSSQRPSVNEKFAPTVSERSPVVDNSGSDSNTLSRNGRDETSTETTPLSSHSEPTKKEVKKRFSFSAALLNKKDKENKPLLKKEKRSTMPYTKNGVNINSKEKADSTVRDLRSHRQQKSLDSKPKNAELLKLIIPDDEKSHDTGSDPASHRCSCCGRIKRPPDYPTGLSPVFENEIARAPFSFEIEREVGKEIQHNVDRETDHQSLRAAKTHTAKPSQTRPESAISIAKAEKSEKAPQVMKIKRSSKSVVEESKKPPILPDRPSSAVPVAPVTRVTPIPPMQAEIVPISRPKIEVDNKSVAPVQPRVVPNSKPRVEIDNKPVAHAQPEIIPVSKPIVEVDNKPKTRRTSDGPALVRFGSLHGLREVALAATEQQDGKGVRDSIVVSDFIDVAPLIREKSSSAQLLADMARAAEMAKDPKTEPLHPADPAVPIEQSLPPNQEAETSSKPRISALKSRSAVNLHGPSMTRAKSFESDKRKTKSSFKDQIRALQELRAITGTQTLRPNSVRVQIQKTSSESETKPESEVEPEVAPDSVAPQLDKARPDRGKKPRESVTNTCEPDKRCAKESTVAQNATSEGQRPANSETKMVAEANNGDNESRALDLKREEILSQALFSQHRSRSKSQSQAQTDLLSLSKSQSSTQQTRPNRLQKRQHTQSSQFQCFSSPDAMETLAAKLEAQQPQMVPLPSIAPASAAVPTARGRPHSRSESQVQNSTLASLNAPYLQSMSALGSMRSLAQVASLQPGSRIGVAINTPDSLSRNPSPAPEESRNDEAPRAFLAPLTKTTSAPPNHRVDLDKPAPSGESGRSKHHKSFLTSEFLSIGHRKDAKKVELDGTAETLKSMPTMQDNSPMLTDVSIGDKNPSASIIPSFHYRSSMLPDKGAKTAEPVDNNFEMSDNEARTPFASSRPQSRPPSSHRPRSLKFAEKDSEDRKTKDGTTTGFGSYRVQLDPKLDSTKAPIIKDFASVPPMPSPRTFSSFKSNFFSPENGTTTISVQDLGPKGAKRFMNTPQAQTASFQFPVAQVSANETTSSRPRRLQTPLQGTLQIQGIAVQVSNNPAVKAAAASGFKQPMSSAVTVVSASGPGPVRGSLGPRRTSAPENRPNGHLVSPPTIRVDPDTANLLGLPNLGPMFSSNLAIEDFMVRRR